MSENRLTVSILIISDTAAKDASTDACGPELTRVFKRDENVLFVAKEVHIVPDEIESIQSFIVKSCDGPDPVNLIVTSGGTGFAIKDNTPEAVSPLIHKHASGLVHAMLSTSLAITPFAMMARPVAGVRNKTLIITLPGSPKGARENLEALIKQLPHACQQAAGANSRQLHAGGVKKLEKDAGVGKGAHSGDQTRGRSAYMFYANEQRHKAPKDPAFGQLGTYMQETWKSLTELEKAPYLKMALANEEESSQAASKAGDLVHAGHKHHHHDHHHHDHAHDHAHGADGHKVPLAHTDRSAHPQSNDPNAGPSRRYRASPYPMLEVDAALALIREHTPQGKLVFVPVNEGLVGSVLAQYVQSVEAVPAFRASIVDGYAIKFPASGIFQKGVYPVALISHAQASDIAPLEEGQIARITTGAPLPPGADAIVMVEDTILISKTVDDKEEKEVEILTSDIQPGENVREIGSDIGSDEIILHKGETITSTGGELGLLAATGVTHVKVYKKPIVGILSTGDEIVPHDRPENSLRLGEVRDTNRPTLITAVKASGFAVRDLGIASDTPGALESTLRAAFTEVDILITTGGVSMGELDLLKPTIERTLGGTIHFGRVNMKPGKPTTFGTVSIKDKSTGDRVQKLIFSLPGNPASAIVCFHLFVLPSLHRASGIEPAGLTRLTVVLEDDVRCDKSRPEYHRVVAVAKKDGALHARSTGGQRSSRVGSFRSANALLIVPAGQGMMKRGEKMEALLMGKILADA